MGEYRKSIWEQNPEYRTEHKELNIDLIHIIDTIQSIEAAKKRTPPIPLKNLIKIAEISKELQNHSDITAEEFKRRLDMFGCYGAGIKTRIAIMSRLSEGKYPPIDEKNLRGLRNLGLISEKEEKTLNGKNREKIARVYVEKILPKWNEERAKGRKPENIDDEWAKN